MNMFSREIYQIVQVNLRNQTHNLTWIVRPDRFKNVSLQISQTSRSLGVLLALLGVCFVAVGFMGSSRAGFRSSMSSSLGGVTEAEPAEPLDEVEDSSSSKISCLMNVSGSKSGT